MNALVLVLSFALVQAKYFNYEGYKVYEVNTTSEHQSRALLKFRENPKYDFWTELARIGTTSIMVNPSAQETFENTLRQHGINYTVLINDVENTLGNETVEDNDVRKGEIGLTFTQYHRYPKIVQYLQNLTRKYPNLTSLNNIGYTSEKRPLLILKISTGGENKPAVFIDGGIHAREWIAPAQVLYIIKELVENPENRHMIENVDWHIFPVVNPDGYEYSQSYFWRRLWRKTRSRGVICNGVDGNRNFDYKWGGSGSSDFRCSLIYKGSKPFSEPETAALRDYVMQQPFKFNLYLTFHSFGKYLLYPWGHSQDLPENAQELHNLGLRVAEGIRNVSGTNYRVGSAGIVLYECSGSSDDWMMGAAGVPLSYVVELPGGGILGFDLPPSRILPVVKETFEGVKVFHDYVKNLQLQV